MLCNAEVRLKNCRAYNGSFVETFALAATYHCNEKILRCRNLRKNNMLLTICGSQYL